MITLAQVKVLFAATDGKSFEPRDPGSPKVAELIEAGYVRRVDGRCGFERFKDSMLVWTDAGKAACA